MLAAAAVVITIIVIAAPVFLSHHPAASATMNQTANGTSYLGYQPLAITVPASDPFTDPNGPYYHNVYVATSKNGLNFTAGRLLWNHGSVPGAVLFGNAIFVYYVDGTQSSPSGIIAARSTDFGKSWTLYAAEFAAPASGICHPADPDPVLLGNGTIRLFVTCFASMSSSYIASASSADGISFAFDSAKGIFTPPGGQTYTDPDAIHADGQWGLYISQGRDDIAYNSTDGTNFTEIGAVSTAGAVSGSIALPNGTIRHYFCGMNGIESALSKTPSSGWTAEPGYRIATGTNKIVCDPSPLLLPNGTYMLFYKVQP
jgi:hypothetical protein